ncbi:MAG: response regulator [bacterium]|nr:response regulator [bacterium]
MRALIIDDSRAMRTILGNILEEIGFEVVQAGDGQEALTCLKANPNLDLALVDWNLPVMSGFEFVEAVRADEEFADLKLMMVTTETELKRVSRALDAGANEYIMKPFTKEMLLDKLALIGVDPSNE